jgi:signal transduction histidine kinase
MDWKLIIIIALIVLFCVGLYFVRRGYLKRLSREVKRAQSSERIKSIFLANVSHALRTPLNAIIGFSEIILKEQEKGEITPEQLKEAATHINKNGHQLLFFIQQLLELSNFESSVLTFSLIEVNLAELMASYRREALHETKPGVSVMVRSSLSPHCKGTLDTNLMHQLMMHLLRNAAHYTKEGTITINYEYERKGMRVTITDTGDGIPKEYLENIFSLLHLEDALTLDNRASELGLSICKAITDSLGGEISLNSELGKGTTATVWFPCRMRDMTKDVVLD